MNLNKEHIARRLEDSFYGWAGREKFEASEQMMGAFKAGASWAADFLSEVVKEEEAALRAQSRGNSSLRSPTNDITNLWGLLP